MLGPLLRFSMPILLALFLQALYGAVDLLVVGLYATPRDVSGVAIGSQIMMTYTHLVSSFAMGTTILLGQKIGEGNSESGGRIIGTSVMTFLLIGLISTALLPLFSGSLASVMNAPAEAFAETKQYIAICGFGSIMIIAYNVLGSVMRGIGDSVTPLITVAIAGLCNIVGDLLLVAVLHMGAAGAAIATVASQAVSVVVSFFLLRRITRFGIPIALQDLLVGFSFLVILAIVNKLGLIASAGVGVAEKVCAFIMLIPAAFMQAMSAYVAQNHGAGKPERSLRGLMIAIGISTIFGVVMFCLAFFHGDLLCRIFAKDAEVIAAGFDYLRAYAIDCLFTCFLFCFIGYYNGLGRTAFVMMQGISAAFLVRIPVAYYMSTVSEQLFLIGLSVPISTIFEITASFTFFFILRHREKRRLLAQN
ncbi:MAG: MATE family efflux transporter [Oscillospiraceae bacterium]|nr:MATE family efflux transporter [Oscillospiraceae bacterium]